MADVQSVSEYRIRLPNSLSRGAQDMQHVVVHDLRKPARVASVCRNTGELREYVAAVSQSLDAQVGVTFAYCGDNLFWCGARRMSPALFASGCPCGFGRALIRVVHGIARTILGKVTAGVVGQLSRRDVACLSFALPILPAKVEPF